jgi:hypothetical protein
VYSEHMGFCWVFRARAFLFVATVGRVLAVCSCCVLDDRSLSSSLALGGVSRAASASALTLSRCPVCFPLVL